MKKILIYISILLTSATFNGCYDLNTYPGDKVSENLFYQTEEHAKQGLMGIYGMLRDNHAYGYQFLFDHLAEDGALDENEHHVISKVAGLLHVTHGEYIAAKLRAREQA